MSFALQEVKMKSVSPEKETQKTKKLEKREKTRKKTQIGK
jgi:hypothetical protein